MNDEKVKKFIALAGQTGSAEFIEGETSQRELGAQLLLSETLEYVIKGLGVIPSFNGVQIADANALKYVSTKTPNKLEMLDGLCDVAYTMFWNSVTFGIPLEKGFDLVCDNNLEKFVKLTDSTSFELGELSHDKWDCQLNVSWPEEVEKVFIISYGDNFFAVGKDKTGKVRKPSSYKSVNLEVLI